MKLDAKAYFEPDALTDINAHDFAQALASFGLEMVMKGDGIAIRKAKQSPSPIGVDLGEPSEPVKETMELRDRIDNWVYGNGDR